jgi:hypothetical protein
LNIRYLMGDVVVSLREGPSIELNVALFDWVGDESTGNSDVRPGSLLELLHPVFGNRRRTRRMPTPIASIHGMDLHGRQRKKTECQNANGDHHLDQGETTRGPIESFGLRTHH